MKRGVTYTAEFVGLPGSGKSTVCAQVALLLAAADISTVLTTDFVRWNSARGKVAKIVLTLRHPLRALRRLSGALGFWLSLDDKSQQGLRRSLEAPVIAACLDHYLKTVSSEVALLDQADMQGIWSIGALSNGYASAALASAVVAAQPPVERLYVCMRTDPKLALRNLRQRANGGSRFDTLVSDSGDLCVEAATPLMDELIQLLSTSHEDNTLILDAAREIDIKAALVADQLAQRLRNSSGRESGTKTISTRT